MRTVSQAFDTFLSWPISTPPQREVHSSHRASIEAALGARFRILNFFESGSFSHGTGIRNFSDTDVFVSLGEQRPSHSYDALEAVRSTLNARFLSTPVGIDKPAVVVEFGSGFEAWEVIPAYFAFQGPGTHIVHDIAGALGGPEWIRSAPKAHLAYVNASNQHPTHGSAKALARLLKAWKYYNAGPVSSFYLELWTAENMARQQSFVPILDLHYMRNSLQSHALAPMQDPSGLTGTINACTFDSSQVLTMIYIVQCGPERSLGRRCLHR